MSEMRPTQAELINLGIQQWASKTFHMMPGRIVKYDAVLQKATVEPLLRRPLILDDEEIKISKLSQLKGVPVRFTRGGKYFSAVNLEKGDPVTLEFCDQSIEGYKNARFAKPLDPDNLAQSSINNAIVVPGWYPFAMAIKADVRAGYVIGKEADVQIHIRDDVVHVTSDGNTTSDDWVAMSSRVDDILDQIYQTFNLWTPVANDGGLALKTSFTNNFTTQPSANTTASKNLRADLSDLA